MLKKIFFVILSITISMPIVGYSADVTIKKDKKPLYWVDTMEPEIHYPGPGKSRMGMELVPVYEDGKQKENKKD